MKKEKQDSIFRQEMKRDFRTFRSLDRSGKIQFIYDYYRWYILAAIVILFCLITAGRILYEGHRPHRLQVIANLNSDEIDCSIWFNHFYEELQESDNTEVTGDLSLNQDMPLDYDNMYYNVQEMVVMTTVSSKRMDVAVCGPDMYDYLLRLNACLSLDEIFTQDELDSLEKDHVIEKATANLQYAKDGSIDASEGIDGYFALDISDTTFGKQYNDLEASEDGTLPHLYAVIIRNTERLDDSIKLIQALLK